MEKKGLNFSAPLISARRYSSPLRSSPEDKRRDFPSEDRKSIPLNRSELNMGEVANPGSVPFLWEQIPGKAKRGNESQVTSPEELPSPPKLPPGKKSGQLTGFRTTNKLSGELVNVLRPQNKWSGEINTLKSHRFSGELQTLRNHNKLSGELNSLNKFPTLNDVMVRWGQEGSEMNASFESENDDDDDDATLFDANGTSSRRGSFSFNCSVSGLSVTDRPEIKPSGIASTEAKARDFMMDRFLPAAKAMTLEPSQHASRKRSVVVEQCREVNALPTRAQTPPRQNMFIVPYTGPDIGCEESDEEEGGYDDQSAISVKIKACGFLPWFCSKNSLQLLNPLPSMKNRSKALSSKVSNLVKTGSMKSPSHKLAKHVSCTNHTYKANPAFKSCELQIPKYTSRPMFYSGELQTRSGSPYRSSRSSTPSRYRSESPNSRYQKGVGFLAAPKRVDQYDDNQSKSAQKDSRRLQELHRNTRLSSTRSPVVENTLYMDSVNIPKVSHSILNLSKNKRHLDATRNELGAKHKTGSIPQVAKSETFSDATRLQIMKARGLSGPLVCSSFDPDFHSYSSVSGSVEKDVSPKCKLSDHSVAMQSPLTPPLPKSPSESWLSHKLPAVSPRNSVSYSSLNSKLQSRKQNAKIPGGAKWETIVRSSHLHHDHGRYSEELVTYVPQGPQTWK